MASALHFSCLRKFNVSLHTDTFHDDEQNFYAGHIAETFESRASTRNTVYLCVLRGGGQQFRSGWIEWIECSADLCVAAHKTGSNIQGGHCKWCEQGNAGSAPALFDSDLMPPSLPEAAEHKRSGFGCFGNRSVEPVERKRVANELTAYSWAECIRAAIVSYRQGHNQYVYRLCRRQQALQ